MKNHIRKFHPAEAELFMGKNNDTSKEQIHDEKKETESNINKKIKSHQNQRQKKCSFCNEFLLNNQALTDQIKKIHYPEA